jgi:hypothetical protein
MLQASFLPYHPQSGSFGYGGRRLLPYGVGRNVLIADKNRKILTLPQGLCAYPGRRPIVPIDLIEDRQALPVMNSQEDFVGCLADAERAYIWR